MLLSNIQAEDIALPTDANREDGQTEMIPHKRKVTDEETILGAIAALPEGTTEKDLSEDTHRLTLFGVLYHAGLCLSTIEGRFPLATVQEVEENRKLIADYLVVPESDRVIAIRKADNKEYRQGNVELKGKHAPKDKFESAQACVNRNTLGIVRAIRKAAKNAAARLKESGEDAAPTKKAPVKKAPAKKAPKAEATPPRKAPARKTPARKAPARKTPARKAPAKK